MRTMLVPTQIQLISWYCFFPNFVNIQIAKNFFLKPLTFNLTGIFRILYRIINFIISLMIYFCIVLCVVDDYILKVI